MGVFGGQENEVLSDDDGPEWIPSSASDDVTDDVVCQHRQVVVAGGSSDRVGDRRGVVLRGGRQTDLLLRLFAGRARVGARLLPVQLRRRRRGSPDASSSAAAGFLRTLRDQDHDASVPTVND